MEGREEEVKKLPATAGSRLSLFSSKDYALTACEYSLLAERKERAFAIIAAMLSSNLEIDGSY